MTLANNFSEPRLEYLVENEGLARPGRISSLRTPDSFPKPSYSSETGRA